MPALKLSAEDRYAILDINLSADAFPGRGVDEVLADTIQRAAPWQFLWDLREGALYDDVRDVLRAASRVASPQLVLIDPDRHDMISDDLQSLGAQAIPARPRPLPAVDLDLDVFDDWSPAADNLFFGIDPRPYASHDSYYEAAFALGLLDRGHAEDSLTTGVHTYEEVKAFLDEALDDDEEVREHFAYQRTEILRKTLSEVAGNSLLVQVALYIDRDRIVAVPYHGASVHRVPTPRDELVLLKPSRVTGREWARFRTAIVELEAMLNDPRAKERDFEKLLRANPLFLRGLNYRDVYHQVVLPRTGAKDLRPDIIAEPLGSQWADILDLKLPSQRVLVGRENRASLASALHQAAAQLREYSAFFEDREAARRVEEEYGFKCYKPRLAVIVGRDPRGWSEAEQRRALTVYPELEVVTYDKLLDAARTTLLL